MSAPTRQRSLDLVFVVDPIETLNAGHDTSVAIMESAQARGHRVHVTTMRELGVANGRAVASCRPIHIQPAVLRDGHWTCRRDWYDAGAPERWVLDEADAVFIRTDPPVDDAYLRGTYVLDFVDQTRCLMVNSPAGLRHANEKLFTLRFADLGPDTVVTADLDEIVDVTTAWGAAVVKPTNGMAGRGIMLLRPDDPNLHSILEAATHRGRDQVIVQRYIPRSTEGDRRVIVVDGEPVGVVRRVAARGEFRCNMAAGASVVADTVSPRDKEICHRLADTFAEYGLVFVGIDVIGDLLTEINVTSPTGLREIDAFSGSRLADSLICHVEQNVPQRR